MDGGIDAILGQRSISRIGSIGTGPSDPRRDPPSLPDLDPCQRHVAEAEYQTAQTVRKHHKQNDQTGSHGHELKALGQKVLGRLNVDGTQYSTGDRTETADHHHDEHSDGKVGGYASRSDPPHADLVETAGHPGDGTRDDEHHKFVSQWADAVGGGGLRILANSDGTPAETPLAKDPGDHRRHHQESQTNFIERRLRCEVNVADQERPRHERRVL